MIINMGMVSLHGPMGKYTMETGTLVCNMVGPNTQTKKVNLEIQYGIKGNVSNGFKRIISPQNLELKRKRDRRRALQ